MCFAEETSRTNECHLHKRECGEHMHCEMSESVTRCRCNKGYVKEAKQLRKCIPGKGTSAPDKKGLFRDDLGIIFHIAALKRMLRPVIRTVSPRRF